LKGLLQKAQSVKLLLTKIKGHAAAYADLQAQLLGLLPKNFLMTFPICAPTLFSGNLGSAGGSSMNALGILGYRYSAYLSAMEVRCQRLLLDPLKDAKLMAQLTPFLKQELSRLPQDIRAQWPIWLEEFRIALFAQPMKTAFPVSEAKLKALLSGGV
jgi:ATP-dependent helicase HrpA